VGVLLEWQPIISSGNRGSGMMKRHNGTQISGNRKWGVDQYAKLVPSSKLGSRPGSQGEIGFGNEIL